MIFFGSISILQYEKHYKRNVVAQTTSLIFFGSTVTEGYKIKLLYFEPWNGLILKYNGTNFQQLISRDQNMLQNYLNDRSIKTKMRKSVYHDKFNNKYPLSITNEGIKVEY